MKIRMAVCLLLGGLTLEAPVAAETIVMMRHAEKPPLGLGQLTCRGLNRAMALPRLLMTRYGNPAAIFAPNPGVAKDDLGHTYNYVRPLATIEPTAVRAGLPVDTRWGFKDIEPLQEALLRPEFADATVFVAWEHHLLRNAARAMLTRLGADAEAVPPWADDDYDSLYVLTVTPENGVRRVHFRVDRQGLDHLSDACPGD